MTDTPTLRQSLTQISEEKKMATYIITCVLVFLCQALVVLSARCAKSGSYFYCCGDCQEFHGPREEACVTSSGERYHSTYICPYNYKGYDYSSMSVGAVLGIVFGCMAGFGLLVCCLVCVLIKFRQSRPTSTPGQVINSGQTIIINNNPTTQGYHGCPVQERNAPMHPNQQRSTNSMHNTRRAPDTANNMQNTRRTPDTSQASHSRNLSDPPPSYEQVTRGNHI